MAPIEYTDSILWKAMNFRRVGDAMVQDQSDVDVDLGRASVVIWMHRWFILGIAIVFGVVFFFLATVLPKKYTAWTVVSVAATQQYGDQALGALAQFSGIARLAGVSLPGSRTGADRIALLESRIAIGNFIEREDLLPRLFSRRWNKGLRRWKDGDRVPTLYEGIRYFQKHILTVVATGTAGLVTVRIQWSDPATAAQWANDFIRGVNDFAKKKEIARAQRHLQFLNERAKTEPYVSQQEAIARLTETELGQEMVARGTEEYAFTVIDPAIAPEKPSFPKRSLFSVLGVMLGCLVAIAYIFLGVRRGRIGARSMAVQGPRKHPNGTKAVSADKVPGADGG